MVAFPIRPRLILPLAPLFAVAAATVVAATALALPSSLLDSLVMASGLPAVLPAAEAPLGLNARLALMITGGGAAAAVAWFVAYLAVGARTFAIPEPRLPQVPRRAPKPRAVANPQAVPAGPARAPLIATRDLGTPFLEVRAKPEPPAERPVPKNLDQPLAAFDPTALPEVPAEPIPVVAPLAKAKPTPRPVPELKPGERLDTYILPTPIAAPETEATIHALLDRLERGISRREGPKAPPEAANTQANRIESTLGELHRLATAR